MNYHKIHKKNSRSFFLFSCVALGVFWIFPVTFGLVSSFSNTVALPFWGFGDSVKKVFHDDVAVVRFKVDLEKENSDLRTEITKMRRELYGYNTVVAKNLELEKELSFKKDNGVFAGVIERPNISAYDTFTIDAGKSSGIAVGDKVIAGDDVALGIVEESYSSSAKIRLYSSGGRTTNVLLGPKAVPATLKGFGGGTFEVDLPNDTDITIGDSAVLPGNTDSLVGYVKAMQKNNDTSFQSVYIGSPESIFELKYVQVLKTN